MNFMQLNFMQLKKRALLTMLCTFFLSLWGGFLIVSSAVAAVITVCPPGPTECNCTTIHAGINMASSGDTVLVGTPERSTAETYNLGIYGITKGVNVVSQGDDTTFVPYTGSGHTTMVLKRATLTIISGGSDSVVRIPGGTTPEVTLDGFTIENASADDLFLIRVGGGSPTIKNNIIRNNTGNGHAGGIGNQGVGTGSPSPIIENNFIHNVHGPGIGNGPNSHAYIHHNEIWDCRGSEGPGVGLWGYASPTIEDNIIFDNDRAGIGCFRYGLNAEGGTLTIPVIKGNTLRDNNQAGIRLSRESNTTGNINVTIGESGSGNEIYGSLSGIRLDNLTDSTIENNNIHDQKQTGIRLDRVTTAIIHDNQINHQDNAGIRLDNIGDITISDNDIHHSNYQAGIRFYSNVMQATVENNQIHENRKAGIRNTDAGTLFVQNNNDIYLNGMGGINIDNAGSTNTIQGNTIRENSFGGIRVASAANVTVSNNDINDNGYGGINHEGINELTVSGNHIYGNDYGGINIQSGYGTISDNNTIEQNGRGGIGIKAPCTFVITGNQINGNLRGGIHTGEDSVNGTGFVGTVGDAHLIIKKNNVYGNGQSGFGGGIDVRHADGVIYNNLVYENHKGGIRFGDYIDEIINNTVVGNGENGSGGGIIYDDLLGAVNDPPSGCAPVDIPIKNNICVDNEKAGINVKICPNVCPVNRDYNLLCRNNGEATECGGGRRCIRRNLGGCDENGNEIFFDPLFVYPDNDDYHLQSISGGYPANSPAIGAGDDGLDMGAYGGDDPITP